MNDTLVALQNQSLTEQKESLTKLLSVTTKSKLIASWKVVDGKLVCHWTSEYLYLTAVPNGISS